VVPFDSGLSDLAGWWLEVFCSECGKTTLIPLRLLAAQRGWNVRLGSVVDRLQCGDCRVHPSTVALVEDAAAGPGQHANRKPGRLVIR